MMPPATATLSSPGPASSSPTATSEVSNGSGSSSSMAMETTNIRVSKSTSRPVPTRQPTDLNAPVIPAAPEFPTPGGLQRVGTLLTQGVKRTQTPKPAIQGNTLLRASDILNGNENQAIPRTTSPNVDLQKVMDHIKRYKCYKLPGFLHDHVTETDLPPFDSLEPYDIDEEKALKLWEWEAKQLVDAVNCNSSPKFTNPMFDGVVTEEGHDKLGKLADRIMECDIIRELYNGLLLHANMPNAPTLSPTEKLRKQLNSIEHMINTQGEHMDQIWTDEEGLSALYDLVDYVTAICARFLTKCAHGPWHIWVLGSIATWRAAVKVIARSPSTFFQRALDTGRGQLSKPVRSLLAGEEQNPSYEAGDKDGGRNRAFQFDISGNRARDLYFVETAKIKSFEEPIIDSLFGVIRYRGRESLTKYDFCTIVYETGLNGFQAHIYQDKHGEILGTSLPNNLRYSAAACAIMNETISGIEASQRARVQPPRRPRAEGSNPPNRTSTPVVVKFEWNYSETAPTQQVAQSSVNGRHSKYLKLDMMASVVPLMVSMKITSPKIVDTVKDYLSMVSQTSMDMSDVKPYIIPRFDAFFRFYTKSAEEQSASLSGWVAPLSSGLMTRQRLLAGDQRDQNFSADENPVLYTEQKSNWRWGSLRLGAGRHTKSDVMNLSDMISDANQIMEDWTMVETGVIVSCRWYVSMVMAIAAILVLGGLAIGFTVGQRLPAVDPFNITTYCWVLAAFVILIGRSIRVENWPWRSFLYAQVECKSVSELHAVTGVHEQLIIAKLLHEESTSILQTRGPHNFPFRRTADTGFSIDVPITMWTMCLSGLIVIQVVTPEGNDALACLDVRRGTEYAVFVHDYNSVMSRTQLACLELIEKKQDTKTQYRIRLTKQDLQWTRVKGLFTMPEHEAVLFV
ncbi:hypothetical protein EX30DRAFT_365477 [Ascodesmis nigricans]|uniref:Uncharacterized protein n=1 Tax=Ascodesmis nigricans TaxID=341454 RepID=A0A4S2MPR4_9PEZI|nr:hypothetical protein EX30DRAFT_365477 [Ascodesmis nigricans]